jgi:hypothetical protein
MDWFDRLKDKLFGEPVQRSGQLYHGPLKRTEPFLDRHRQWLAGGTRTRLLGHYRELLRQEQLSSDTDLHLFSSEQATGMQIKRPADAPADVLHHLMEEFKNCVLAQGYRLQLSDHKIGPEGGHRERYYLKPEIPVDEQRPPLPQRYGNVLIEAWGDDELQARHLKVLVTVYSDRLYMPAESGMSLINSLLGERGRDLS